VAAANPVVLAGPGVVRDGAVGGLHAMAAAAGVGVLNTWGAKGVYDWRSRHHLATAGLQAFDFELGGLAAADLIVATGVDPLEAPDGRWQLAPVVTVEPGALDAVSEHWRRADVEMSMPALRARLGEVAQEGWRATGAPLPPSRVTLTYASAFASGGMVAADPGTGGYWVARTFTTTELGGAIVPASADAHGLAAACVVVARLARPGRRTLAVVDGPVGDVVRAVLEVGDSLGAPVGLEVWDPSGPALDVDAHQLRLRSLSTVERSTIAPLATDGAQMARMVEAAGPVVAWGEG
jgi:thiamine pyrophosphate-dependent acetolactate synthase large subunit-like protein